MDSVQMLHPWREVLSQVLFFVGLMALLIVAISGSSQESVMPTSFEKLPHRRNEQLPFMRHSVSDSATEAM